MAVNRFRALVKAYIWGRRVLKRAAWRHAMQIQRYAMLHLVSCAERGLFDVNVDIATAMARIKLHLLRQTPRGIQPSSRNDDEDSIW